MYFESFDYAYELVYDVFWTSMSILEFAVEHP